MHRGFRATVSRQRPAARVDQWLHKELPQPQGWGARWHPRGLPAPPPSPRRWGRVNRAGCSGGRGSITESGAEEWGRCHRDEADSGCCRGNKHGERWERRGWHPALCANGHWDDLCVLCAYDWKDTVKAKRWVERIFQCTLSWKSGLPTLDEGSAWDMRGPSARAYKCRASPK